MKETRNAHSIIVLKIEEKHATWNSYVYLGRNCCVENEGVNWIYLARGKEKSRSLANMAVNHCIP
jgi:hypothetical protein